METRDSIYEHSVAHFLTPIKHLMDDKLVTEVMINGPNDVRYEVSGKIKKCEDTKFSTESRLIAAARNIAEYNGKNLDEKTHEFDARLPTGERVHVIVPPASRVGTCMTIRKFDSTVFTLARLIEKGSMNVAAAEFLGLCVACKKNIVISGGTGSGKTSLLNALSDEIPDMERVIVIEDTSELALNQKGVIYLEARKESRDEPRITIRDLIKSSLRMRPDRIIVGEVRGGEALDLIQSMITGHEGSLSTVHANNPRDSLSRLETLSLMSDLELPISVARVQVASAVDVVIQIQRYPDGSRRIKSISEVIGLRQDEVSDNEYEINDLFQFHSRGVDETGKVLGELVKTGIRPSFASLPYQMGYFDRVNHCSDLFTEASIC